MTQQRVSSIPRFQSIEEYNFKINISTPRYADFDIRSFEDNMKTVRLKMPPFRVPCFQLAILKSGSGEAVCQALFGLVQVALKAQRFKFKQPVIPEDDEDEGGEGMHSDD